MSLSQFFFAPLSTNAALRSTERRGKHRSRRAMQRRIELGFRIDAVEDDIGYLSLLLGTLIETIEEKGVITKHEFRAAVARFDQVDGVEDGKLDVNYLREIPEDAESDED